MKICLLVRDLKPGGVPSLVGPLTRGLETRGHEVTLYNLGLESEIAPEIMRGLKIVSGGRADGSGYRGHLRSFARWAKWLNQEKPELIQSHVGLPDIYLSGSRWGKSLRVRAALAPQLFPAQPAFGYAFERAVSPWAFDHHVAVSEGVKRNLLATGISEEKITVIPNPISASVLGMIGAQPKISPELPIKLRDGLRIAYFGRFSPEKGPDRVIPWFLALKKMVKRPMTLYLAGMGAGSRQIENDAYTASQEGDIQFVGFVKNPSDFLPHMDVAISPSRYEGLPIAMIEAAALGCSIIATQTDGSEALRELCPSTLIVPNQDSLGIDRTVQLMEMVRWLELAPKNPLKPTLSPEGLMKVRPDTVAQNYDALYRKLAAAHELRMKRL